VQGTQAAPVAAPAGCNGPYKGVSRDPAANVYLLKVASPTLNGRRPVVTHFGSYPAGTLEGAQQCARAHDSIQLLLHGPCAATNFPYAAYTPACLQAAAEQLRGAGYDVAALIASAQRRRGSCTWAPGGCIGGPAWKGGWQR
jgi:hypothetical protein